MHGRADIMAKAGQREFLRPRATTHGGRCLQDESFPTLLGKANGSGESVGAGAYNDGVVVGHGEKDQGSRHAPRSALYSAAGSRT